MSRRAIVAENKSENLLILASVRGRFLHLGFLHTESITELHQFKQFEKLSIAIHIWDCYVSGLYARIMPPRPQLWGAPHQIKIAATNPHTDKSAKLEDGCGAKDWKRENLGSKEIWLQTKAILPEPQSQSLHFH